MPHFHHRALIVLLLGMLPMSTGLYSQPTAPTAEQNAALREWLTLERMQAERPAVAEEPAPVLSFDLTSRSLARAYYRAIYNASEGARTGWTGTIGGLPGVNVTGSPGTTSAEFKEDVLLRINWFRAMAGIPANVVLSDVFSAKAQQAALMMTANNKLDHNPPANWLLYTADGAQAAAQSNLALGMHGPAAITGYVMDGGANNTAVGHRRWLLYPQTRTMGTGDIPPTGSFLASNATWVMDGNAGASRPTTRQPYVAWPPAGYVPYQVVYPRWSFSLPGADFSAASVSMTRAGAQVAVSLEPLQAGAGEPTLVWVHLFEGATSGSDSVSHPKPAADLTYEVQISGVRVNGQVRTYSYSVTVFDPYEASPGGADDPARVVASSSPGSFKVTHPSFTTSFQWRTITLEPAGDNHGAEGGMQGLDASTSVGYNVVQTGIAVTGAASYHLAHLQPVTQYLQLPGYYYVTASPATLQFHSRLGAATSNQVARVQVSTDKGRTWIDLRAQAGTGQPGETAFVQRTLPLDTLAGRTFQMRFAYTLGTGPYFNQTFNGMGWYLDDIRLSGVSSVTFGSTSDVVKGETFAAPGLPEGTGLQARSLLFERYPLDWGPILPDAGASPGARGRLANLSVRSQAGTGDQTLIAGFVVAGGGKPVLVRGVGPTLATFGVTGAMQDPELRLVASSNGAVVAGNDNWWAALNATQIVAKAKELWAFDLAAESRDAALLTSVAEGVYTAQVSDVTDGTGIALAEVYDADTALTSRLVNLSARTNVGTGDNLLVIGFVVTGGASQKVLIRGVGPSLAQFGVGGVLQNPQLVVFSGKNGSSKEIARNDDWGGAADLADAAAKVFAFALPPASKDAVLLLTLPPGTYTAQVSGVGGTSGVALAEVYEVND